MSGNLWNTVVWDVARAGGITAYVLLALAVIVGLALSLHLQSSRWPRLINSELHNFLSLLSLIFTLVHVLAVWIDPFTKLDWKAIFVPFATSYHPWEMALGIVALYLGLAVGASTWLRPYIGYAWWRRFHFVTFLVYLLVTMHSISIGTDTRTPWALGLYAGSGLLVAILLIMRLTTRTTRPKKALAPTQERRKQEPERAIVHAIKKQLGTPLSFLFRWPTFFVFRRPTLCRAEQEEAGEENSRRTPCITAELC